MATITKPSIPGWQKVEPSYRKVMARHVSPYTLLTQAQTWSGEDYHFVFTFPPMKQTNGLLALKFLRDLQNGDNKWLEDVTRYVSSDVSDKAAMPLRVVPGSVTTQIDEGLVYRISFEAEYAQ